MVLGCQVMRAVGENGSEVNSNLDRCSKLGAATV
jgi:hypothetical protein